MSFLKLRLEVMKSWWNDQQFGIWSPASLGENQFYRVKQLSSFQQNREINIFITWSYGICKLPHLRCKVLSSVFAYANAQREWEHAISSSNSHLRLLDDVAYGTKPRMTWQWVRKGASLPIPHPPILKKTKNIYLFNKKIKLINMSLYLLINK